MFDEGRRLRALHGDDAVIDLALGQPLEPPEDVRAAWAAAAAERHPGRFAYLPNAGDPDLRERIAAGAGVPAECAVVTAGAAAAMTLALRAFTDPGDSVVVPAPHFGEYRAYCAAMGARFVPVPARGGSPDLGAVVDALDARTGAVVLNSPNNPSGHVVTDGDLAALAGILDAHRRRTGRRVMLLCDEVYRLLHFPPAARADPFAHHDRCALVRSFSKDLGLAGERIGCLVLHPSLRSAATLQALEVCQRALGFVNAPATAQRALLRLPSWDVDLAPFVRRLRRALGAASRAGFEVRAPDGGIYLWMESPMHDARGEPDGLAFAEALASHRVLLAPGAAFGVPTHVRVCFTSAEPSALERAFEVMAGVATGRSAPG